MNPDSPATWNRELRRQELFTSLWELLWLALGIATFTALCTAFTA